MSKIAAALLVFFLAMVLHPEAMLKAQAQIDAVVGRDRLPTFSDREKLPYIEAMVREIMRWRTVGPIGLPRETVQVRLVRPSFDTRVIICFDPGRLVQRSLHS